MANNHCRGKLGMGVSVVSIPRIFDHFSVETTCKEIEIFMKIYDLSMFGLVCNVIDPTTKQISKHFLLYTTFRDLFANSYFTLCDKVTQYPMLKAELTYIKF